jgi:hypothetical protein
MSNRSAPAPPLTRSRPAIMTVPLEDVMVIDRVEKPSEN